MGAVTYEQAQCTYPRAPRPAVAGLDLEIADGELLVLVGPSGCGKSTSLRMLAGLEPVSSGRISIGGRDVTALAPRDRDIAMVFQNYALYPHMDVADNMAFSLRLAGVDKHERDRRVLEAARLLDLEPYLGRLPKALSGGQRQRVAMGRAIVRQPQVFCMDEPLSNLDAKLRVSTRTQIAALQQRLGTTTVYVTHDQVEAMTMGDRVAVMRDGELQQVDRPLAIYDRPANLFVAGFIGSPTMNLLDARLGADGVARVGAYAVRLLPAATAGATSVGVTLGVRPEHWRVVGEGDDGLEVTVRLVEELGADSFVHGTCDVEGTPGDVTVRVDSRGGHPRGSVMRVAVDPARVHVFDTRTGERLG